MIFHWSFDPVALWLGPVPIRWYGLCWGLAFIQSEFVARRILARLGRTDVDVGAITLYALMGTIAGARLGHCLFYDPGFYLSHPLRILAIWEGGMASHGGAVGLLSTLAWAAPRFASGIPLLTLLDVVAIPATIGGALVRLANFLNSEILGVATSGTWGVVFDRIDALPRVPVQLFEAIAYLMIALLLWWQLRGHDALRARGRLTGLYFVLVFGARAVLEFWKMPQAAYESSFAFSVGQWLSLPFIALGLYLVWRSGQDTPRR